MTRSLFAAGNNAGLDKLVAEQKLRREAALPVPHWLVMVNGKTVGRRQSCIHTAKRHAISMRRDGEGMAYVEKE